MESTGEAFLVAGENLERLGKEIIRSKNRPDICNGMVTV